jgi:hypothetical protein
MNFSSYELNELIGIPNHPPCDVCGKVNSGSMGGTGIGDYQVCGHKCFRRMEMKIYNGLVPWRKEERSTTELMRNRISQLKHQLKAAGIKPNKRFATHQELMQKNHETVI